uniref:TIL domain-containing protein n=1 Tax=Anisakis simplex TaxID=6269 RepID=A0A0M3JBR4_ANISI
LILVSSISAKCALNEEFRECGTACPANCDQMGPIPCTRQCVRGCFCKKGYVLNRKGGVCVRDTECKRKWIIFGFCLFD